MPNAQEVGSAGIEVLGALRIADIPVAAGLVFPAQVVFVGHRPATYDWTLDLYRRLGAADKTATVADLGAWQK